MQPFLKGSEDFELTGCFSPDYNKSKIYASQHNLVAYPSIDALFNYADALVITDFAPDFLSNTEKAIKSFKHVLITNPFLAGLEEIFYLRKLSEESGVLMQIAGGFKLKNLFPDAGNSNWFFSELKHSFGCNDSIVGNVKFMEYLLADISLLLILLKGIPKKVSINSWDSNGRSVDLLSSRIELDNGGVANILLGGLENCNSFCLNIYGALGVQRYEMENPFAVEDSLILESFKCEFAHFEKSIRNKYQSSLHNDMMFQALELAHKIRNKTVQNLTINISH
ncbi:MAG TPA: Gfo/Idh/MocA family oxidoreductase [Bacteroidales bacterium]|nr:Gfo/Idh/MocA family oxidoreductase [Bacteroidales bacterium]